MDRVKKILCPITLGALCSLFWSYLVMPALVLLCMVQFGTSHASMYGRNFVLHLCKYSISSLHILTQLFKWNLECAHKRQYVQFYYPILHWQQAGYLKASSIQIRVPSISLANCMTIMDLGLLGCDTMLLGRQFWCFEGCWRLYL